MRSSFMVALAIGLSLPSVALAERVGPACHVRAICSGVSPGGGRIVACLARHRAELSVGCKVALADRMLNRSSGRGRGRMAMGQRMAPSGYQGGGGPGGYGPGGGAGRGPADEPDGY